MFLGRPAFDLQIRSNAAARGRGVGRGVGRDGCPQPSVRGESYAPRERFYPRSGQRRVGDNPPYPRHREGRARPTLIASLWPSCPQVLGYAPCPHVTVPTCPLEGSAFAGWDGCPQPSVHAEGYAPRERFDPRSGQRRVEDNPPYPIQVRAVGAQLFSSPRVLLPSDPRAITVPVAWRYRIPISWSTAVCSRQGLRPWCGRSRCCRGRGRPTR